MMDEYLLEAMREVDAMLPGTPPIAPPSMSDAERRYAEGMRNAVVLSYDERMLCNYHGVPLREYAAFKQKTGRAPW